MPLKPHRQLRHSPKTLYWINNVVVSSSILALLDLARVNKVEALSGLGF